MVYEAVCCNTAVLHGLPKWGVRVHVGCSFLFYLIIIRNSYVEHIAQIERVVYDEYIVLYIRRGRYG